MARFIGTPIANADQKYNLLNNLFKPGADYSFPKHANGRSFGSDGSNGILGLLCIVGRKMVASVFPVFFLLQVVTIGLIQDYLSAVLWPRLVKHSSHFASMPTKAITKQLLLDPKTFLRMPDIQCHLNQAMASRISLNRQKLHSIFKSIVFWGRQNIALRGHRDDATRNEKVVDDLGNHGNFRALLNFRVDAGDSILAEHLATAPLNTTYTSKTIQN